ncbi:MAG: oligosaccharide flippase family protein [Fuerstiella sp.]|nr:oligosaccharide flippase family protein [Fuerstiella sp.]
MSAESANPVSSIKDKAVRGVAWNFLNAGSGFTMQLVRAVVLARLLSRTDYGLTGKAVAATFVATLFTNIGFGTAIVQARHLSRNTVESIFTLQFLVGLLLALCLAATSTFLAEFYGDTRLIWLVTALGTGIWLNCAMVVPVAMMQRELRFKELNLMWISVRFVSFSAAILMALTGCGYWTLIIPDLVSRFLAFPYILWRRRWRPSLRFAVSDLKPVASVSAKSFATFCLATANTSLDYAILGRFFSRPVFGLYYFGYQRVRGPMRMAVTSVRSALFPAFTKATTEEGLRSSIVRTIPVLAIVTYPLAACLFLTIPQMVPLIFGHKWQDTSPIMQAFTVGALFIPANLVFSSAFLARAIFKPSLIEGSIRVTLIGMGLIWLGITQQSILTCAMWVVTVEAIGNLILLVWGTRLFKVPIRSLSRDLCLPFAAILTAALCDLAWGTLRFEYSGIHAWLILALRVLQIVLVSGTIIWLLAPQTVAEIGKIFRLIKN